MTSEPTLQSSARGLADRTMGRAGLWACVALFVLSGIAVRIGLAIRLPTVHRPDELFQSIEPAYYLWTGRGVFSWEWRDGIRSWMIPDVLYLIMRATSLLHLPSRAALPAIWATLSILSAGVIGTGVGLGWRRWGLAGAAFCGVLTAFWPDLVYFGPKTLSEVQGGNLLVVAAGLASLGAPGAGWRGWWRMVAIGFLLGLSFTLRFQLGLALGLVAIWAARLDLRRGWLPLILGTCVPLAALGVIDWWTWGSPFQSIWKNILVNLVEQKALKYGVSPIGAYLFEIVAANGAATVPLFVLFLIGARDAPLLASLTVLVIGFHSAIAHKEISFIYAALPCALITIGMGAARLVRTMPGWLRVPLDPDRATSIGVVVLMAVALFTAASEHPFAQKRAADGLGSLWGQASSVPDLCGLGLYGSEDFPWALTLGYSGLNRPAPIYLIRPPDTLSGATPAFNYAIADPGHSRDLTGYEKLRCSSGYCLLRRSGTCHPEPEHEFSRALIRSGE